MLHASRAWAALALLVMLAGCALANPCDDGMQGGDMGTSLKKVSGPAVAPWTVPFTGAAVAGSNLNKIFSWPRGTVKKNCKLTSYTVKKLCVPQARA